MTIKKAIKERHMVRKYKDKAISEDKIALLNAGVTENNKAYGLNITLVTGNSDGLSGFAKMFFAKGVNNYFVLAGKPASDLDERLGYCGADLILYAQTLGLRRLTNEKN